MSKIKLGFPIDTETTISDMSAIYTQPDGLENEDQFLEIRTEDVGAGHYFVIKTARWAFENIDEIVRILNDFKDKCGLTD